MPPRADVEILRHAKMRSILIRAGGLSTYTYSRNGGHLLVTVTSFFFIYLELVDSVAALFSFATRYEASALHRVASQPTHNLTYISFLTI